MNQPPRWLTILNRANEYRRDLALQRLGQAVAESESVHREVQEVSRKLAIDSMNSLPGNKSITLDLERLHQRREHRNELLTARSQLKSEQEQCAEKIAEQRVAVQERTTESQKFERLGERIAAQHDTAHQQTANRMLLEDLAVRIHRAFG